ncbi:YdcF family protein [Enterococcus faecalis]|uniref:YdcF family protein n=1 Tax=Enterococcus faecalis TaxID=1351 RepID=UPI00223C2DC5|nr:YdcF family protein [Enterococcus faecalis]MCT2363152.1 YdcF family protein [Enterococcus faecalis]
MQFYGDLTFLGVYLLGLFFIPSWRKKKKEHDWLPWMFGWTVFMFFSYVLYLEIIRGTAFFLIPIAFFGLFALFYFKEKRRLLNGTLFNIFLVVLATYLGITAIRTNNYFLITLAIIALLAIFIALALGLYALIIFLYWNAVVVMRKEGRSLGNLLTLLLAIGLTLLLIYNFFFQSLLPTWLSLPLTIAPFILTYFAFVFYNFLTVSTLYQFNQPKYTQDYIVVLGSGLINGEIVPPLLQARINKAIQFYKAQNRATLNPPKIVMSGGQGPDELLPESVAMKMYALTQGIPDDDILVEAHSKNTLENMRFSKETMIEDFGNANFQAIFTTNNYHLFRAGLFALMAGLKADGIGAKTAFYFLPNAFIREFIAIVVMYKRRHIIVCGLAAIGMVMLFLTGLIIQ